MNSILKIIKLNLRLNSIKLIQNRYINEWHLLSAICVQRVPQIIPEMNYLEKKMSNILSKVEVNNSLYSDHEMRHFEDLYEFINIFISIFLNKLIFDSSVFQTSSAKNRFWSESR
jgi:hypothetical protein